MDKIAGSAELKGHVSLDKTVEDNIKSISSVTGKDLKDIKVIILNRPRNKNTINTLIDLGVQLDLIQNGDIVGAMRAVNGDADLLLGIGSAPEGVISAVAVKGLKGVFQGRMWFHEKSYQEKVEEVLKNDAHKIWDQDNLCTSNDAIFVATGVCDGWIPGVQYNDNSVNTWSRIIYVETGEVKTIESVHSIK